MLYLKKSFILLGGLLAPILSGCTAAAVAHTDAEVTPANSPVSTAPAAPAARINAPGNLKLVKVSDNEVTLSWRDNSADESGFHIETATNPAFTASLTFTVDANVTSYSDKTVAPIGDTYYYRVTAFITGGGESEPSDIASLTIAPARLGAPNGPSGLAATAIGPGEVNLRWTDISGDETAFLLERSTDSDFTLDLVSVMIAANTTTYTDTSVTAQTTYYYRVSAFNAIGLSLPSSTATVATPPNTTVPAAPSNLGATAISPPEVSLSWTNPTTNYSAFRIERAVDANFSAGLKRLAVIAPEPKVVTMVNDTTAVGGTTYYYRIFAVNTVGDSPVSNIAKVATP